MDVPALLTLMGNLSLGNDNITPGERTIFLQYLNLAHLELYQVTANFNQDLLIRENLANEQDSNKVTLSKMPYVVSSVYDVTRKNKLTRRSLADVLEDDPDFSQKGLPCHYFIQKNGVYFIPAQIAVTPVVVWYAPQPSMLTEEMPEQDIPYPLAYHPVLADGGLYYLFQQEGGFKNTQKEDEANKRWETGKTRLLSYLYTSSGEFLSTFSNA